MDVNYKSTDYESHLMWMLWIRLEVILGFHVRARAVPGRDPGASTGVGARRDPRRADRSA